jgi:hypothetical protein
VTATAVASSTGSNYPDAAHAADLYWGCGVGLHHIEPSGADAARVAALTARLREGRLRVLIAGEAKRGKSTVANALVGSPVLPAGVTPLTAIATALVYGVGEHVTVAFEDGTAERRPLGDLPGLATFVLPNKADRLDAAERPEALAFTTRIVSAAAGPDVPVYAVSARAALAGQHDPGFAKFAVGFRDYLRHRRAEDLEQSVAGHARRITGRLFDEVRLARRASQLRAGQAAGRVEAFRGKLAAVAARRGDAADLAWAQHKRLLSALNDSARDAGRRLAAEMASGLTAFLAEAPSGATGAEVERDGAGWLAVRARDAADAWRDEQRKMLEASLAEQDARLIRRPARRAGRGARGRPGAAGSRPGAAGHGRAAGAGQELLLLQHRAGRPDRAAGRRGQASFPRRAGPAAGAGAPPRAGHGSDADAHRPGPRRPAVPATGERETARRQVR